VTISFTTVEFVAFFVVHSIITLHKKTIGSTAIKARRKVKIQASCWVWVVGSVLRTFVKAVDGSHRWNCLLP
jgi:hypothetical protein